jgi:hypothetical protein
MSHLTQAGGDRSADISRMAAVQPGAGRWRVGYCVDTATHNVLTTRCEVTGRAQVTSRTATASAAEQKHRGRTRVSAWLTL